MANTYSGGLRGRSRLIHPSLFSNEDLALLDQRLPQSLKVFLGLICYADREGRLIDRPKRLWQHVLAQDPLNALDMEVRLQALAGRMFIMRYHLDGDCEDSDSYIIQVLNFKRFQKPHHREAASKLPAIDAAGTTTYTKHPLFLGHTRSLVRPSTAEASSTLGVVSVSVSESVSECVHMEDPVTDCGNVEKDVEKEDNPNGGNGSGELFHVKQSNPAVGDRSATGQRPVRTGQEGPVLTIDPNRIHNTPGQDFNHWVTHNQQWIRDYCDRWYMDRHPGGGRAWAQTWRGEIQQHIEGNPTKYAGHVGRDDRWEAFFSSWCRIQKRSEQRGRGMSAKEEAAHYQKHRDRAASSE